MFTNVEPLRFEFRYKQRVIDWHPYVMQNYYILNKAQVRKLGSFICRQNNYPSLDIYWQQDRLEQINDCH